MTQQDKILLLSFLKKKGKYDDFRKTLKNHIIENTKIYEMVGINNIVHFFNLYDVLTIARWYINDINDNKELFNNFKEYYKNKCTI